MNKKSLIAFKQQREKYLELSRSFWSNIPWDKMTNKEIESNYHKGYVLVQKRRKQYAPETIQPRKEWKSKVQRLINKKQCFILTEDTLQPSAIRNAAYKLEQKMQQHAINNNRCKMYLKG